MKEEKALYLKGEAEEREDYRECGVLFAPGLMVTASCFHCFKGAAACMNVDSVKMLLSIMDPVLRVFTFAVVCGKFALFLLEMPAILLDELMFVYTAAMLGSCALFLAERMASKFELAPENKRTRFVELFDKLPFTSPLFGAAVAVGYCACVAVMGVVIVESASRVAYGRDPLSVFVLVLVSVSEWAYSLNRMYHMHGIKRLSVYLASAHTAWTLTFSLPCAVVAAYYVASDPRW